MAFTACSQRVREAVFPSRLLKYLNVTAPAITPYWEVPRWKIGEGAIQNPFLGTLASFSSPSNLASSDAYFRYHQHQPSLTRVPTGADALRMLVVEDFKGIAVEGPSTAPVVDSGGA
jgi:hypothetical protein